MRIAWAHLLTQTLGFDSDFALCTRGAKDDKSGFGSGVFRMSSRSCQTVIDEKGERVTKCTVTETVNGETTTTTTITHADGTTETVDSQSGPRPLPHPRNGSSPTRTDCHGFGDAQPFGVTTDGPVWGVVRVPPESADSGVSSGSLSLRSLFGKLFGRGD